MKWIPFLGVRKLHPVVVAYLELDPKYEWKSFTFSFGNFHYIFAVWRIEED